MKRKHLLITVVTILIVLLTTEISILTSYVSNFVNPLFKPFALPLLGIITLIVAALTIWLYFLQRDTHRSELMLGGQNRRCLLKRVSNFWITGMLEHSLHQAAHIELGLSKQPDAIENPWRLALQESNLPPHLLPAGTHISQVYNDTDGELLILGEPGAGKTTLLLELARDLLERAEQDESYPMPVVFNLSSWAIKREPLSTWLIKELSTKYKIPPHLSRSWVNGDLVLPLLDGLDEVDGEYRAACINAINAYRSEHGLVPMVVCSRSAEYLNQKTPISLHCAVIIQPLTMQQIDDYLTNVGEPLVALDMALRIDPILRELATTPLMLNVLSLTYYGKLAGDLMLLRHRSRSPETLTHLLEVIRKKRRHLFSSTHQSLAENEYTAEWQQQVFEVYIQRTLSRRKKQVRYTSSLTRHWLTYLAQQMKQHHQTVFSIEQISVDWLPNDRVYWLFCALMGELVIILPLWLFLGFVISSSQGPLIGLLFGLGQALMIGPILGLCIAATLVDSAIGIPPVLLRLFLWWTGSIPWNYTRFLDYATECALLRKAGGGYIFVHRLLLDYFASLNAPSE